MTFDKEAETVTLQLTSDLSKGETTVCLEYTGVLNDQMRGFYRSKYTHPDSPGEERYAGVTQFEVRGVYMNSCSVSQLIRDIEHLVKEDALIKNAFDGLHVLHKFHPQL